MADAKNWLDMVPAPGRLRVWRKDRELSQHNAATAIGIDLGTYNAFERGRKRPGLDLAFRIEEVTRGRVRAAQWARARGAA